MFTPSIILWMIINTVATSGALFVALQASGLDTGKRLASEALATNAAGTIDTGYSQQSQASDRA
jgi:hypothetical protein